MGGRQAVSTSEIVAVGMAVVAMETEAVAKGMEVVGGGMEVATDDRDAELGTGAVAHETVDTTETG